MYNDSKNMTNLYERDMSMYDSKSTLASVSSLDIVNDSNRSHVGEVAFSPPRPPSSSAEVNKQNVAKLSEELAQKERLIASLQEQVKELKSTKTEIESLRITCKKSDIAAKVRFGPIC